MKFVNPLQHMSATKYALMLAIMLIGFAMLFFGEPSGLFVIAPAVVGAEVIEQMTTELTAKISEVKGISEDMKLMHKEVKERTDGKESITPELKKAIDDALAGFNTLNNETIPGLKQKLVLMEQQAQPEGEKSWGQQFIESDAFKGVSNPGTRRASISAEVKTVTSANAGGLIRSARESEITTLLRERRVMRDLLRTIPVATSSVDYVVQATRTNNAAPVAEAAAKPYSDFTWSSATVNVRVLAHLAKITRQAMDDAPRLMGEIDAEMRYGLGYVEERQFLYGSGVGQNLHGIIPQATAFASGAYVDANATRIDVLRLAMLQTAIALLPADGIVLNDADWAYIELQKTDEGAYLFANPQGNITPRLWGLPIVVTPAMDANDFLVGNFQMGAVVYDRMGVEVLISTENVDDFEKNLATVRAEERVAIAVKRPGAFVTGDFTTAIADVAA